MDLFDPQRRFGPLSRAGSALNLLIATGVLVGLLISGESGWVWFAVGWLAFAAVAAWVWTRRHLLAGGVGLQLGVAEAGPHRGRQLTVTHDGVTWTVEVHADPDTGAPAAMHAFDNDEFARIESSWRIRWTA